jgi:hypothetical protein
VLSCTHGVLLCLLVRKHIRTFYRGPTLRKTIGTPVENAASNPEMDIFRSALKQVMRVSKDDLKEILAQEKVANADKPKRGPKLQTLK